MKKKLIIALILVFCGIILYSKNINKLEFIKNIKQSINENNITKVDVTGITLGKETEHEHIYKTMYDDTKHWEECTVCNEKRSIVNHNYIDNGWSMGQNCSENNVHKYSCECGYSYTTSEGRIVHNIQLQNLDTDYQKIRRCLNCEFLEIIHNCINYNGTEINCRNLGTCSLCGYTYNTDHAWHTIATIGDGTNIEEPKEIYCQKCNISMGTLRYMRVIKNSNTNYKFQAGITVPNGTIYESNPNYSTIGQNVSYYVNPTINGNLWETEVGININEKKEYGGTVWVNLQGYYGGLHACWNFRDAISIYKLDEIAPTISNISIENSNTWSKSKTITITGIENWTNTVNIEILDDEENIIYEGSENVTNGNYSISFMPEIEAGEEGRKFKAIVTDSCENSIEQEFTISKIDGVAPEITSRDKVADNWAKEKNIIFTAIDHGIGNVQIAFNNVSDYSLASKNGTEYSKEYKLVGDVYTQREANVYYKDELGNVSTKKVTIDKIDNTAPSIIEASFNNNKLNVQSHDRHETEGEGSGVVKYRFVTSTTKLENPEITLENSTEKLVNENIIIPEIYKVKYIYVVAEDLVGNVSSVYEVEVPQLELTSKVNLSSNNGKGAVELDWSGYDIQNKYFVIYRKQKWEEEWKTIVNPEQKFNGNKYIDNLGNDTNSPTGPNINIAGNQENNRIKITTISEDNGTKYQYYIESYDSNNMNLLNSSK